MNMSPTFDNNIPAMVDHMMGEQYNVIRYVAYNLPKLLLLLDKLNIDNLDDLLDGKVDISSIGAVSGVAPLGLDSKVPSSFLDGGSVTAHVAALDPHAQYLTTVRGDARYAQIGNDGKLNANFLPSFVDDVLEFASAAAFPAIGEAGKIYVALADNGTYRWSGATYIKVGDGAGNGSLGSTDSLVEGALNLYFTSARVRSTVMTGLVNATGAPVATDTLLVALNKIMNQAFNHNHDLVYAPISHTHTIAQITGLQAAIDSKQAAGNYLLTSNFTWANLGGIPTTFPPSAHNHDSVYQKKITSGTAAPSGGVDGDVYFKLP